MQTPKPYNKSTSYVLPMIGNHISEFIGKHGPVKQFRNTFIADNDKPEYTEHLFLLYEFSQATDYLLFEEKLKLNPNFIDSYEPDYKHTMFVFGIPIDYKNDYHNYLEGKYSKFNPDYKQHIMRFHTIGINHPVMQTLLQAEERYKYWENELNVKIDRNAEISSPPNLKLETFQEEYKAVQIPPVMRPSNEF